VPRNAEVIRQWHVLRAIEQARAAGTTIDALARMSGVTSRTIRRDLEALQEAGFPLYDDRTEGRTRWKLSGQPFRAVETGFTLAELSALYFSRSIVECLAGTPFQADLSAAFDKLEAALTPRMRQFFDRLPRVIASKWEPGKRPRHPRQAEIVARLLDATLHNRRADMRYRSISSGRVKTYAIDPYRLVYAQGGLYVFAYVPEYGELRTFAVERIETISLREERFEPSPDLPLKAFPDSLGVHHGPPERIEIEFTPAVAAYVREREWHSSQRVEELPGGGLLMTLDVCNDGALRSWILGFGAQAKVRQPATLAAEIATELDGARQRYTPLAANR
jgi:predicted DNA-binding transcriptional regulator YafY